MHLYKQNPKTKKQNKKQKQIHKKQQKQKWRIDNVLALTVIP